MNNPSQSLDLVRAYHARVKHHFDRYAASPGGLDWDTQPNPFREFRGAPRHPLRLLADELAVTYAELDRLGEVSAQPLNLDSLSLLFELSLGLAAWKQYGDARWALRCNPSSGNLHPTEGYALVVGAEGLPDGVYHYHSHDHALEQRCAPENGRLADCLPRGGLLLGLSSIHWREEWKYGERAFRYCQHDTGHALAALTYAAACLGWRVRLLDTWGDDQVATIFGLDRESDFKQAEPEDAELALWVEISGHEENTPEAVALTEILKEEAWRGRANRLTELPKLEWPIIREVAVASHKPETPPGLAWQGEWPARLPCPGDRPAAGLIRGRRSAQHFDPKVGLRHAAFYRILDSLLPRPQSPPWNAWPFSPRLHPVLFVHRVEDLPQGLYAMPRGEHGEKLMRELFRDSFAWTPAEHCPLHLPLYLLVRADSRNAARALSCHQPIAGDSAFSLGMLAEFDFVLETEGPWAYRRLFWEAGLLGQVLYLEAEAAGIRGTGIGCYFDDAVHEMLGLGDTRLQSLYHFTVGGALVDSRLQTLPPYAHLDNS